VKGRIVRANSLQDKQNPPFILCQQLVISAFDFCLHKNLCRRILFMVTGIGSPATIICKSARPGREQR